MTDRARDDSGSGRRVLIVTAGGRGDVAPYTGLAAGLRAAGHEVAIATHGAFGDLVRAAGVELRLLPENPLGFGLPDDEDAPRRFGDRWQLLEERIWAIAEAVVAVTRQGADIVLMNGAVAPLAYVVAEAMDLPSMGVYVAPQERTGELAPIYFPGSLGRWGNRAAWRVVAGMGDTFIAAKPVKRLRAELGLEPRSPGATRRRQERDAWPVCCGFSPTVVPRPQDWRPGVEVVGYWWPERSPDWAPSAELTDFLDAGAPPVYVGFGTLARDGERLAEIVPQALRRAGVRGVIQAPWADMMDGGDDLLPVGEAPHDWLFPRMAAVVHAAGAGVAAAGLRAGVPAVSVPFDLDQPFWARRLAALGVGPAPIPAKTVTADPLTDAVRSVVTEPSYAQRASTVAAAVATEDGTTRTVEIVNRCLGSSYVPSLPSSR